jgi:isoleucyl-tRNA synthetase
MQQAVAADYERYQFHLVAQKLQSFCSEDLGAFFVDILKDRLYTCKADSKPRRSAQTALHHITHSLVRLMAPILSFTAEELWQVFAGKEDDSVFFHTWHELPRPADGPELLEKWARLRELRDPVRKSIEALRADGKVGSSLQAEVKFQAEGRDYELLASLGAELKYLLITSAAQVYRSSEPGVKVQASEHPKCERCWHYLPDVSSEGLCRRCQTNLHGPGETREHV